MSQKTDTAPPRTVRLHLINGTPNGIIRANSNRSVLAIRSPRTRLKELCRREEANRKGIYLLSGRDPQDPNRRLVYIGESDCIRLRVPIHERNFDFFDHVAIAVGKDDTFSKDHYRYIESELLRLARDATECILKNGTDPEFSRLSEGDRIEAEEFLQELLLLLAILDFDIFRTRGQAASSDDSQYPVFEANVSGALAIAQETDDGFIIRAGSTARVQASPTFPLAMKVLREKLLGEEKLVPDSTPGYYRFAADVSFSSPSSAATLVAARVASGPEEWKLQRTQQTYREWRDSQLQTE
jgi:hypothetical protein